MNREKLAGEAGVRLDKWLWAARFYKTRRLAQDAVTGGKITVNGVRAKPAKEIRCNDQLTVQLGPYQYQIQVLALSERRGPAQIAQNLYRETKASIEAREKLRLTLRAQSQHIRYDPGRPAGKDRRHLRRLKRGAGSSPEDAEDD
jgi:ribosome-associated heat shock protein Hsp15